MIPKAQILDYASTYELLPTTVEKDYVLGWLLAGVSQHPVLSRWVFKGGTCLKKCFFETYRFSEDLDFTVPKGEPLSDAIIARALEEVAAWVESNTGILCPAERIQVEVYTNPRSKTSYQAKVAFKGPLELPKGTLQRVKFDVTQDEDLVEPADLRDVFHPYSDAPTPGTKMSCYSVNEILAEKSRALYERSGRARDVFDIVHLSRDFRDAINPSRTSETARRKFAFKGLPPPTVAAIMARVEGGTVRADWENQLRHQLPQLPSVDAFLDDLPGALAWWLEPAHAPAELAAISARPNERPVLRQYFPAGTSRIRHVGRPGLPADVLTSAMDRIRFAARNRLCAEIVYEGIPRIVEPYSLRYPNTGNTLLYCFEALRGGRLSNSVKAFNVAKIQDVRITDRTFAPKFLVEL